MMHIYQDDLDDLDDQEEPEDDSPPNETPNNACKIRWVINEVRYTLRDASRRVSRAGLSHDELASLGLFTEFDAKELSSLILNFAWLFGDATGLNLGLMSSEDFYNEITLKEMRIRELMGLVEDKTEQAKRNHHLWQALVVKSIDEQKVAQATESDLRERIAHLERALVYASAQVSERR